jgi:hypothetical protein
MIRSQYRTAKQTKERVFDMSIESTPAQLAALAELLGITPGTHFYSWRGYYVPAAGTEYAAVEYEFIGPCPFSGTPESDNVWLAPLMRWLAKNENEPMVSGSHVNSPCWGCVTTRKGDSDCDGKAYVYSLLHAALSARVPKIVAIYPEGIPQ